MKRIRALVCAGVAVAGIAGTVVLTATAADGQARVGAGARQELLPDLMPITPTGLTSEVFVEDGVAHARLGFYSAGQNVGVGPLIVEGHRASTNVAEMVADQVIMLRNGEQVRRPGVGQLRYVQSESHEHWHLLKFMTYELRRAADNGLVVPDQKTGFCLGDRYNADPDTKQPEEPESRVYNSNCGPKQTTLLGIVEGISVGWGDVYEAWRDGQYLELTGLPAGKYVVVHRVNPERTLKERSYGNNAASVLISIAWPDGKKRAPVVKLLKRCPHSARCK